MVSKGFGYVIEAFVSVMVVFAFVAGFVVTNTAENRDWSSYRSEITKNDLRYTFEASDDAADFAESGELSAVGRAMTDVSTPRFNPSTSEESSRTTRTVGMFIPPERRHSIQLKPYTDGKCDLGDISDDITHETGGDPILMTDPDSYLAQRTGVILYVADSDPVAGSNGVLDYDSVYVDNETECQISPSEGPILFEEMAYWGNKTDDNPGIYFEINDTRQGQISPGTELPVNKMRIAADLRSTISRADYRSGDIRFDGFRMEESLNYDIIFFPNGTLNKINANDQKLLDFLSRGSMMVAEDLTGTGDLDGDFMEETGLEWVDLDREGTGVNTIEFTDSARSQSLETFFEKIGCFSCGDVEVDVPSKVTSSQGGYITDEPFLTINDGYQTENWDIDTQIGIENSNPSYAPERCGYSARWGDSSIEVHMGGEKKPIEILVSVPGDSPCNTFVVNFGQNPDEVVSGTTETLEGTEYTVTASGDPVGDKINFNMDYTGSSRVEAMSYIETFENQEVDGFVRMPSVYQDDQLGGPQNERTVLASAAVLKLLNSDRRESSSPEDAINGQEDKVPYRVPLWWDNQ